MGDSGTKSKARQLELFFSLLITHHCHWTQQTTSCRQHLYQFNPFWRSGQAVTSFQQKKLRTTQNLTQVGSRDIHSSWERRDMPPSALVAQLPNTYSDSLNPDLLGWAALAGRPCINRNQINGTGGGKAQALLNRNFPLQGILQVASCILQ